MNSALFLLVSSLLAGVPASAKVVVHYSLLGTNDPAVNTCVLEAIADLRRDTCLEFSERPAPRAAPALSFVDSGHCSWQESNSTVHLGRHCAKEDTCSQLIARALTNERVFDGAARQLNLKFNCTDKCTILCQHGGNVTADCRCQCGYGLEGEFCERLSLRDFFTDPSCGQLTPEPEGSIALSSYPNPMGKGTFCQWLVKPEHPWETVEFEFLEMDLDARNALPGQQCADSLVVLGARGLDGAVPCNAEFKKLQGRRFRSERDWVMFVLNGSPASAGFKGPLIKYRLLGSAGGKEIRSFADDALSAAALPGPLPPLPTLAALGLLLPALL